MSGYRRPTSGSYSSVTSPSGYGSPLGRYDLTNVPTHYTGGATRLVSSCGIPRRYQLYSRSDTPSGITNYDVIRRAADPLAARYRQNRHSWAAGGGTSLSRSSTVSSVSDLRWRGGRTDPPAERRDGLLAPDSADPPTSAGRRDSASSAGPTGSAGSTKRADSTSAPKQTYDAESSGGKPEAVTPAGRTDAAAGLAISAGHAGSGQAATSTDWEESKAPVAPPRRADSSARVDRRDVTKTGGPKESSAVAECKSGVDRKNDTSRQQAAGGSLDQHSRAQAPPPPSPTSASMKTAEKAIQPPQGIDKAQTSVAEVPRASKDTIPAPTPKGNACQTEGGRQQSKVPVSVDQNEQSQHARMISNAHTSDTEGARQKKEASPLLKNVAHISEKQVNSASSPAPAITLRKQQDTVPGENNAVPVQIQAEEYHATPQNGVTMANEKAPPEMQCSSDIPVRPPRHIPASGGSRTPGTVPTLSSTALEQTSDKPNLAASTSAEAISEKPGDGAFKAPEPVNDSPQSKLSTPIDYPVSVHSSETELTDSPPSSADSDSSTYTYSSSSEETSSDTELSGSRQGVRGIASDAPAKTDRNELTKHESSPKSARPQVSEAPAHGSTTSEAIESRNGHILPHSVCETSEFKTKPTHPTQPGAVPEAPEHTDLRQPFPPISRTSEFYAPSSTTSKSVTSGTTDSLDDELNCSKSASTDSSTLPSVNRRRAELAAMPIASQGVQLMTSEPADSQPEKPQIEYDTATHLTPSWIAEPPVAVPNKNESLSSGSTESSDHSSTESGSTTSESAELSEGTRTSSESSCFSSSRSHDTDSNDSDRTSSASEEPTASSETISESSSSESASVSSGCNSAAAATTPSAAPSESMTFIAEPIFPYPGSKLVTPGIELAESDTESFTTVTPLSTEPPTPMSAKSRTPISTELPTPMSTKPASPMSPELPAYDSESFTKGSCFLPCVPKPPIIEPLSPILDSGPSSLESESSTTSASSTSESESTTSESGLSSSELPKNEFGSSSSESVRTSSHSQQEAPVKCKHAPLAANTETPTSETATCPSAARMTALVSPASGDISPALAATAPHPSILQSIPEAAALEISPPVTADTSPTTEPTDKPLSTVLHPPAEVQRRHRQTATLADTAPPTLAEVTPPDNIQEEPSSLAVAEPRAVQEKAPPAVVTLPAVQEEPSPTVAVPPAVQEEPPPAVTVPRAVQEEPPPAVVAPPRHRHRPPPADGADVETPAMVARRQRRIRRTASSPEVGDRLVRLDGGGDRPPIPRSPPPNMTPLRRRMVIAQQSQNKLREQMSPSSLHEQFMQVCIKLNETRFRDVMTVAARIATAETINQTDGSGRTALSHLCIHGNGRCVEEFSRLPYVDANLADRDGNTPLHHAAQAGHAAVVSALLENYTEIEVDAKNGKGLTPLIKACVQGKSKCAKLLLSHGADPLTRDPGRGLTCTEWSYYCGRHACARLVEAYLLARDNASCSAPSGGGLKRVSSEPELAPPSGGAPGWFRAKFRRLLGRCSPPQQPPTPPRQRRPSLPAAGEEGREREAPPRPPVRLPEILIEEVEVAVDPVIVRYGDWVAPDQRQRQHNQVVNLCLPGTTENFLFE